LQNVDLKLTREEDTGCVKVDTLQNMRSSLSLTIKRTAELILHATPKNYDVMEWRMKQEIVDGDLWIPMAI